uniref:MTMR6-9 GRAM domain-containing protein n=1 Tax=Pavo cristatus TaxID=9049 RepID=A0A8C9FHJ6_PAVCR
MEHIRTTKVEHVKLLDRFSTSNKSLTGTLYLTATHLLFIDANQRETWILHHHIAAVEKLPLTTSGCPLVIQCKNFRVVHFVVPRERDCHDIYNSLLQLSKTGETSNYKSLCGMCLGNKVMRKIPRVGFVFEKCAFNKFDV